MRTGRASGVSGSWLVFGVGSPAAAGSGWTLGEKTFANKNSQRNVKGELVSCIKIKRGNSKTPSFLSVSSVGSGLSRINASDAWKYLMHKIQWYISAIDMYICYCVYYMFILHVHTYSYIFIFSPYTTTLRTSILPKSCTCCAARICRDLQCLCVDITLVACLLGLVATFRRTSHSGYAWTGHTCSFDWSWCSIDRRFLFIHICWLRTWHEGWRETRYWKNMVMLSFNGSKVWVQRESLERE